MDDDGWAAGGPYPGRDEPLALQPPGPRLHFSLAGIRLELERVA